MVARRLGATAQASRYAGAVTSASLAPPHLTANAMHSLTRKAALALILMLPLCHAAAGGMAVIQGENQRRYSLEYDGTQLRLQSDAHRGIHVIAQSGTVYAVTTAAGHPLVVEGQAALGLLARTNGNQGLTGNEDIARFISLEATGGRETVAGLAGALYRLSYVDRQGKTQAAELVLGAQPAVVELTQAAGNLAADFQRRSGVANQGAQDLLRELAQRNLGLLRFGRHFRLVSLDERTPSADRFTLPAQAMQLKQLENLLPGLLGRR